MSIVGKRVKHKTYGVGIIAEQEEKYIHVEFTLNKKQFIYPDAFEKFLCFEDVNLQNIVQEKIEEKKKAVFSSFPNSNVNVQETKEKSIPSKIIKRTIREAENPVVFYVFQGNTFEKEYEGGYLWAPLFNKAGTMEHHWERLQDVREGDIVLHGCDGYIRAISIAKGACYECIQPVELRTEESWELDGRKVECDYTCVNNPIKTSMYKEDIIQLCVAKYSPFDKNGNGNTGYLYQLNRRLAHIFIEALVKENNFLVEKDYVQNFLKEEKNENN